MSAFSAANIYGVGTLATPPSPGLAGPSPAVPNPGRALNAAGEEAHNWHALGHSNPIFWALILAVGLILYLHLVFDVDFGIGLGPLKAGFGVKKR